MDLSTGASHALDVRSDDDGSDSFMLSVAMDDVEDHSIQCSSTRHQSSDAAGKMSGAAMPIAGVFATGT